MNIWTDWWSSIASSYPFSFHMAVHILLSQVAAPIFLFSLPRRWVQDFIGLPGGTVLMRALRWWPLTWFAGLGGMWIWHLPALHHAAGISPVLQVFQLACFFCTGLVFWWPIYTPVVRERMQPVPQGVFYLAAGCLGCTVLGILVAFAPPSFFMAGGMHMHAAKASRSASDQTLGGLLMWVPGCLIYLTAIMLMFARWYGEPEESSRQGGTRLVSHR